MLSFPIFLYLLATLAITAYSSVHIMNCNQGSENKDLTDALADVEEVAKAAVAALTSGKINGNQDVFNAAYDPLMEQSDKAGLLMTFQALADVGVSPTLAVEIYCRENHIKYHKNDPKSYWEDTAYFSKAEGSRPMPLAVARNSKDKPGAKGSYTTIGFKFNDQYDCSGKAHIFISPKRLNPPPNTDRDLRRYPDIVKNGLDGTHNKIEDIKPLAQTVMHELLHAVGGLGPPGPDKKRDQLINDGLSQGRVYGWAACNARRIQNIKNNDIADCLTFLAQAIYLQIQGKDTYWTTGEVDPKTLRPKQTP